MPDLHHNVNSTSILTVAECDRNAQIEERNATIEWLQSLGLPPLPIAPAQDAEKYPAKDQDGNIKRDKDGNPAPAFTGKNPSYLDDRGIPRSVKHGNYQSRLPNAYELKEWFTNPANGVGTLCGINEIYAIDADIKQFDYSQEAIDEWFDGILDRFPELARTYLQQSHSGGYHLFVKFLEKPDFTNWAESEGGKHRGELIGEGRFIVLAPTIGVSGNPYKVITDRVTPVEIKSAGAIDIYSSAKRRIEKPKPTAKAPAPQSAFASALDLAQLHSKTTQQTYEGNPPVDDRSAALTGAVRDWLGWENWAQQNGLSLRGSASELAHEAGEKLGIDRDRVDRILKSVDDSASCRPSAQHEGGDKACWLKILKVDRETYDAACPQAIKDEIRSDWGEKRTPANSTVEHREEGQQESKTADGEFTQIAIAKLYSDTRWIAIDGKLYRWNGKYKYYEYSPDEVEIQRIQSLAESISFYSKQMGRECFPYANPAKVKSALEWAKMKFAVLPEKINPPGLNCKNGVLQITWKVTPPDLYATIPEFNLVPHSPDHYYTYEPRTEYLPGADSTDCDQLLAALDPDLQEVFLKTTSSSFDLDMVRRVRGRAIRALLCKGIGSNGKDALREAIARMWGLTGVTSVALEDFAQYDDGRKFPLATLATSRINWSSENSKSVRLDELQSLKRAITGEPLHKEKKGKDHEEFKPRAIHLFNVNDIPYLKGAQEAIKSRFAIISFNKVFKRNADPARGEIEADPRFKDDPEFIENNILPALLNRMIEAFKALMAEGIDFSCCDAAMQEIQVNQSHLYEFALENNLIYDPDSVMPIADLWAQVEDYYKATGILKVEFVGDREPRTWADPVRPGDPYIKGQNQIAARFMNLYPQCQKVPLGKNRYGIKGLAFKSIEPPEEAATDEDQIADVIDMADSAANSGNPQVVRDILDALAKLPADLKKEAWARMSAATRSALSVAKPQVQSNPEPQQKADAEDAAEFTTDEELQIGDLVNQAEDAVGANSPKEISRVLNVLRDFPISQKVKAEILANLSIEAKTALSEAERQQGYPTPWHKYQAPKRSRRLVW